MIIGGLISVYISRKIVFSLQTLIYILFAFLVLFLLKQQPQNSNEHTFSNQNARKETKSNFQKEYVSTLKTGFLFIFSNKMIFFLVLASILISTSRMIWSHFLLFFIYFGYSGNDLNVAIFRSIVFVVLFFVSFSVASLSTRLHSRFWLPISIAIWGLIFFGGYAILVYFIPIEDKLNVFSLIIILLVIVPAGTVGSSLYSILRQKMYTDLIPNSIRNSFYSLIPSLSNLSFIVTVFLIGVLLESSNFVITLSILSVIVLVASFFLLVSMNLYNNDIY
jgi:Na+/melibiose symporter-like transporter